MEQNVVDDDIDSGAYISMPAFEPQEDILNTVFAVE